MRSLSSNGHSRDNDAAAAIAAMSRYAGDERLSAIFKQMRAIAGVSQSEMARQLGINVSTLLDFEAGVVAALPPWPETVRIVDRYADLSGVDPSPILSRLLQLQPPPEQAAPQPVVPTNLRQQRPAADAIAASPAVRPLPAPPPPRVEVQRVAPVRPLEPIDLPRILIPDIRPVALAPKAGAAPPTAFADQTPSADDDHAVGFDSRSRTRETTVRTARQTLPTIAADKNSSAEAAARRKRRQRRTFLVISPIVVCVGLFSAVLFAPRPFYKMAHMLPGPMAAPLFAVLDTAVSQSADVKDGLRWIELDDPRLRKADRLQR